MVSHIYTAFLFPVIDGELFLGQRNTKPYKGYWGPVGGKNDSRDDVGSHLWDAPKLIEKMGGHLVNSRVDEFLEGQGREFIQGTAIREFCEEVFRGRRFPEDFGEGDFAKIMRVGSLDDRVLNGGGEIQTVNYFYIATLGRRDFSLSPREIAGFKSLREIARGELIFPMAKIALAHMHYMIEFGVPVDFGRSYGFLKEQIGPLLQEDFIAEGEARMGDMFGAMIYYPERYFGRKQDEPTVCEVLKRIRGKS